ncbi:MAG: hypothetical protein CMB67_03330 [Euryarchaeota archaeon]|nr:hypothetical protein [Euryarchaeota archaeon]|tara:strand:+ start:1658 stop:2638 length:981 start_codon:yes stop_codon:yes gene_type:complete
MGQTQKKPLDTWGEILEIWIDSSSGGSHESDVVSRVWTGKSSDVSEVFIDNESGQSEAISLIGMVPWILVRCSNWTMVPLENLVAASRESGTKIAVSIDKEVELGGAAFALGEGVDAVLVPRNLVIEASRIFKEKLKIPKKHNESKITVREAEVLSIEAVGMGERVCIDLTRRLEDGQGMAIGSMSGMLCMIHGETIPSEFVPTRPFRVNAGAIHSYALISDRKTKYLSELNSGDEVAIVSDKGVADIATIGRLKIENRPLVMVRFSTQNSLGQIVLQQAETVRIITTGGKIESITNIEPGMMISLIYSNIGRHIGMPIRGGVTEK